MVVTVTLSPIAWNQTGNTPLRDRLVMDLHKKKESRIVDSKTAKAIAKILESLPSHHLASANNTLDSAESDDNDDSGSVIRFSRSSSKHFGYNKDLPTFMIGHQRPRIRRLGQNGKMEDVWSSDDSTAGFASSESLARRGRRPPKRQYRSKGMATATNDSSIFSSGDDDGSAFTATSEEDEEGSDPSCIQKESNPPLKSTALNKQRALLLDSPSPSEHEEDSYQSSYQSSHQSTASVLPFAKPKSASADHSLHEQQSFSYASASITSDSVSALYDNDVSSEKSSNTNERSNLRSPNVGSDSARTKIRTKIRRPLIEEDPNRSPKRDTPPKYGRDSSGLPPINIRSQGISSPRTTNLARGDHGNSLVHDLDEELRRATRATGSDRSPAPTRLKLQVGTPLQDIPENEDNNYHGSHRRSLNLSSDDTSYNTEKRGSRSKRRTNSALVDKSSCQTCSDEHLSTATVPARVAASPTCRRLQQDSHGGNSSIGLVKKNETSVRSRHASPNCSLAKTDEPSTPRRAQRSSVLSFNGEDSKRKSRSLMITASKNPEKISGQMNLAADACNSHDQRSSVYELASLEKEDESRRRNGSRGSSTLRRSCPTKGTVPLADFIRQTSGLQREMPPLQRAESCRTGIKSFDLTMNPSRVAAVEPTTSSARMRPPRIDTEEEQQSPQSQVGPHHLFSSFLDMRITQQRRLPSPCEWKNPEKGAPNNQDNNSNDNNNNNNNNNYYYNKDHSPMEPKHPYFAKQRLSHRFLSSTTEFFYGSTPFDKVRGPIARHSEQHPQQHQLRQQLERRSVPHVVLGEKAMKMSPADISVYTCPLCKHGISSFHLGSLALRCPHCRHVVLTD